MAEATGARLGWVPRRAGDRGALEAGALPNLLPGGRPVADASAREQTAVAWHVSTTARQHPAATPPASWPPRPRGELGALLIGGVELADLPDPDAALAAIDAAPFVVSLELRESAVTDLADVVFPVAPVVEKAGSFVNWEGRIRPFEPSLPQQRDARSAGAVHAGRRDRHRPRPAERRGRRRGTGQARAGGAAHGPSAPGVTPRGFAAEPGKGEAVLASWRMLLDAGRLQDGEPYLAGTARAAGRRGCRRPPPPKSGPPKEIRSPSHRSSGEITLPLEITEMDDRVVWLPLNSPGSAVHQQLGVDRGRRGLDRAG